MMQLREKMMTRSIKALALSLLLAALIAGLLAGPAAAKIVAPRVLSWGENTYGQLGHGSIGVDSDTPAQVSNLGDVKTVQGGCAHSLALKNNGTVWAWGLNNVGSVGDGTATLRQTPVQVKAGSAFLTDINSVSAGCIHNLALKSDGTVWVWGHNTDGEIGDGTKTHRYSAVEVKNSDGSALSGIKAVSASQNHSLALKEDGTVLAWGNNEYGELGNGTSGFYTGSPTPVQVENLNGIKAVAAGSYYSLALKEDGTVLAWGNNYDGILGNGTAGGFSDTPVQVSNLNGVKAVAAGGTFSLALKDNGAVFAWGKNSSGQLGDGTTTHSYTPVQVKETALWLEPVPLQNVKAISAGRSHGLALKEDGTMRAWGNNEHGQLGDGTFDNHHRAVKVKLYSWVKYIDAGTRFSLAATSE